MARLLSEPPAARNYPSLTRPVMLMGLRREVAIIYIGMVTILGIGRPPSVSSITIVTALLLLYPLLRSAYARDPQYLSVLARHIRRSGLYLARRPPGSRPRH